MVMVKGFEDLLLLLRGTSKAGELAAEALRDAVPEDALNHVMHVLVTKMLLEGDLLTRVNSSLAIRMLCLRNREAFRSLLLESASDGELLLLSSLDVETIVEGKKNGNVLLSGVSTYGQFEGGDDTSRCKLYGKAWLQRQRRAIQKRLGIESGAVEDATAAEFMDGAEDVVNEEDVASSKGNRGKRKENR